MASPTSLPVFSSRPDDRAALLQGLLIAALIIGGLYVGREVLVPLTLAVLLSFVLTRPLLWLRRLGVPRVLSVAVVVACAFLIILAFGWIISLQVTQLAEKLPQFQLTLTEKIDRIRNSVSGAPVISDVTDFFSRIEQELASPKPNPSVGAVPPPPEQVGDQKPVPVEIHEKPPTPLELFQRVAGTLLPPLVTFGIVLLFVIFILLEREDLRDQNNQVAWRL